MASRSDGVPARRDEFENDTAPKCLLTGCGLPDWSMLSERAGRANHNWPDVVELPGLSLGDVEAGLDESEWMERPVELGGGGVVESSIVPSFMRFFCFIRRF